MSAQSPAPPTLKGPRHIMNNNNNNRRNQKRNMTPSAQKVALVATPPSSPPRIPSPGDTTTDSSNNVNMSKKKSSRSNKKARDAPRPSPAQKSGHQHTSSQPNNAMTPQMKDSPHYAGPTFHASPAPSALPMPSFFSRSLPDSDIANSLEPDNDNSDAGPDLEYTPSKPKSRPQPQYDDHKPTPLDFLFKAAVEARNTQPHSSPEPKPRTVKTPQTDSKTIQRRKIEGLPNGVFSLEMESPKARTSHIGPAFATPYKDRMNALQSASSPSPPITELDEDQRKAKTEALKSLLLNPRPQRPSSASNPAHEQSNGFGDRASPCSSVPSFATPLRTSSGPPTSSAPYHVMHEQRPLVAGNISYPPAYEHLHSGNAQATRAYNPMPRKENLTLMPGTTGDFAGQRYHSSPVAYDSRPPYSPVHSYSPIRQQSPSSRSLSTNISAQTLDTKKMEDDLRRVLKLDASSGFPPNGIQSSYA